MTTYLKWELLEWGWSGSGQGWVAAVWDHNGKWLGNAVRGNYHVGLMVLQGASSADEAIAKLEKYIRAAPRR